MKYYIYAYAQWEPHTGWRFFNSYGTDPVHDLKKEQRFFNGKAVTLLNMMEVDYKTYERFVEGDEG